MYSLLLSVIIPIFILYQNIVSGCRSLGHGNVGYCELDEIKYGGIKTCNAYRNMDYTPPKDNGFGLNDWFELVGGVASILAPLYGSTKVAFANLYNNIGYKYSLSNFEIGSSDNSYDQLVASIGNKIQQQQSLLQQCVEDEILKEMGQIYADQTTGLLKLIELANNNDIYNMQRVKIFEEELDDAYADMKRIAVTWYSGELSLNTASENPNGFKASKYEILFPEFGIFSSVYGEYANFYLSVKSTLCNDVEYQQYKGNDIGYCQSDFDETLKDINAIANNLVDWITIGVNHIHNQFRKIKYTWVDCDADIPDENWKYSDAKQGINEMVIGWVYFAQGWAEGRPDEYDLDDDKYCVYFRMTDDSDPGNEDKWCQHHKEINCPTHSRLADRQGNPCSNIFCGSQHWERLNNECIENLKDAACEKQEELENDIEDYYEDLITAYVEPIEKIRDALDEVTFNEQENEESINDFLNNDGLDFIKFTGYSCLGHSVDTMYGTEDECKQKCIENKDCMGFLRVTEDGSNAHHCYFRGPIEVPFRKEGRDCYLRVDH